MINIFMKMKEGGRKPNHAQKVEKNTCDQAKLAYRNNFQRK